MDKRAHRLGRCETQGQPQIMEIRCQRLRIHSLWADVQEAIELLEL